MVAIFLNCYELCNVGLKEVFRFSYSFFHAEEIIDPVGEALHNLYCAVRDKW